MKILIINLRIGTGSVGRIVSDLYHGAKLSGHICKVAYARGETGEISAEDTYKICKERDIRIHAGLTRLFGNTAFYSSTVTKKFCKWIDNFQPDVIHLHGVYGYYLNMEILFRYFANKKCNVISTLHSCWDFTGHCCYFDYIKCAQWKTGCKYCKNISSYPQSILFDNVKRNYLRKKTLYLNLSNCIIVTPSKWLANLVKESFLSQMRIEVINNGIDLDSFRYIHNDELLFNFVKPVILCVANMWEERKGWQDVVELSDSIDDDCLLVVIGVTKKQIKQLNSRTIAITKTNSKEELAQFYSQSTVLFNPTYEDNYPTVNLEAAACHLPIVTYNTGGSPEIFELGNWGIVIEKRDYQALVDYTKKVFSKAISPNFDNINLLSNKVMVNKYISLYEEIIHK